MKSEETNFFEIDAAKVKKDLVDFIKETVGKADFMKGVLGLSGGLDSSVVASLSAQALGSSNVKALIMPYRPLASTTSEAALFHRLSPDKMNSLSEIEDAKEISESLGIVSEIIDITPLINTYFRERKDALSLRRGNMMARVRMTILYDYAKAFDALVLGTSNKSEMLLGYTTLYGDSACDINPLGSLYKTQVRQLALELGISEEILNKPPSAGLWPGQTDEEELGFTYDEADGLLYYLIEENYSDEELEKKGYRQEFIRKVKRLINNSEHKRSLPLTPQL